MLAFCRNRVSFSLLAVVVTIIRQNPRPQPSLSYQDLFSTAKENGYKDNFAPLKWSFVEFLQTKIDSLSTSCGTEWADAVRWCTKTAWKKEYSEKRFLEQVVHVFDS